MYMDMYDKYCSLSYVQILLVVKCFSLSWPGYCYGTVMTEATVSTLKFQLITQTGALSVISAMNVPSKMFSSCSVKINFTQARYFY